MRDIVWKSSIFLVLSLTALALTQVPQCGTQRFTFNISNSNTGNSNMTKNTNTDTSTINNKNY